MNRLTRKQIRGRYVDFSEHADSFVAVPVMHRGKIRGLIAIESAASGRFSDADVETLKDLAEPTGILLWKLDSYVHNHRHTDEAIGAFRANLHRMPTRLNPFRNAFIARPYEDGPRDFAGRMTEIFESRGVRATDYAHKPGADMVMKEMEAQIAAAHFGIVDLTDLKHDVLLELGMLIGNGKEVLLFRHHEDDRDLPFYLSGRHLYGYALGRKDGIQLSEPSRSGCRAEELIDKFLNDTMLANESFKRARPWKRP